MKEREISLIDLIVEVLLSWRVIVVFMLIGGILLGAFSYVNSSKAEQAALDEKAALEQELAEKRAELEATQQGNAQKVDTEISVTLDYLKQRLTTAQLNNINLALNYEEYAAERQAYINNSLLMQIDPAKVPQSRVTFMVTAAEGVQVENIVRIYEDMVSNSMLTWLENETEDESTALNYSEVVSFERHSRSLDTGSNSFSINIMHTSEELSVGLADLVVRYMGEQQVSLQEQLGTHTIEVVNQSFAYVVNNTLMSTQRNYRNEVTSYIASAENLKANFSANERKYYNLLVSGGAGYTEVISQSMQTEASLALETAQATAVQETTDLLAAVVVTPASVSLMQVILGMVLFAFVYVFYVFVKYLLNTKLRTTDDVKVIYGIAQLGVIPTAGKKKPFDFVDKWILKLRNRNKRVFTEEEATGLAAVAVKMAAKKEEVSAVYCIGCDVQERTAAIADKIGEVLGCENISLTLLNNVLYNEETMAQLMDAKAVVLLEKAGETLYEEIADELELLQRQEIKVLGAIVVE